MNTVLEFGLSNALLATMVALVALALTRIVRRQELVFGVWLLVLAKLLTPPLVGLPVTSLRTAHADRPVLRRPAVADEPRADLVFFEPISDDVIDHSAESRPLETEPKLADVPIVVDDLAVDPLRFSWFSGAIFSLWVTGSAVWFVVAAVRVARFRRILRHAGPASDVLQAEVSRLAGRLGLARVPQVRVVNRRVPPLVWAMTGRATILLPAELLLILSEKQRETLLAHELVHLKRRDHVLRWIELAALGLYWWHPVAWWARRNVEQAAEHCCDARVVALSADSSRAYAEALLATVDFLAESRPWLPAGASGFSQARHVKRRMEMILHPTVAPRASWPLRWFLPLVAVLILPLSIRTLWAEPSSPDAAEINEAQPMSDPAVVEVRVVENQRSQESTLPQTAAKPNITIEERLERLEKMIQALAEQKQASAAAPAATTPAPMARPPVYAPPLAAEKGTAAIPAQPAVPAQTPIPPTPVRKAATPSPAPKVAPTPSTPEKGPKRTWRVRALEEEEEEDKVDERKGAQEPPDDAETSLNEFRREATLSIELSNTNYHRQLAVSRNYEAVKAAYEAKTITLDQLLEAQRQVFAARVSYARAACDLATDPIKREYVFALASLQASNQELNEARKIWKLNHEQVRRAYVEGKPEGVESQQESQAREQYFQFKTIAQQALDDYLKAKKRDAAQRFERLEGAHRK